MRLHHPEFKPSRPYRCPFCERWHVTTQAKNR
jgi:hypothetical protein